MANDDNVFKVGAALVKAACRHYRLQRSHLIREFDEARIRDLTADISSTVAEGTYDRRYLRFLNLVGVDFMQMLIHLGDRHSADVDVSNELQRDFPIRPYLLLDVEFRPIEKFDRYDVTRREVDRWTDRRLGKLLGNHFFGSAAEVGASDTAACQYAQNDKQRP